ncbi:hypothetical protein DRE_00744 [Drechslerella stenobrocha 248]|uniref:Poly A polymerase head domain-containing protein n=1 Tax=Drechslerella stenobrocha 248 TaxID=1043628 RepID=W7I8I9_9PEZI|nr:hypothetical protein DRE_00744 [Drechslerella stenobrocha 248]
MATAADEPNMATDRATDAADPPTITLTETEATIRQLLVDVARAIDETNPHNDIDIGINNMTGFEFASHLSTFLTAHPERYGVPARSVHKIESNPDKSKHLETATTKLLGLDIDFVNLRSETYSEESRIPQMQFGTPLQDALRRDACVNALFYNLTTQTVEDFTGRGLSDLHARIIRTPLPPHETFKDDPLRVLRLIRFAARLDFTILPAVETEMTHPEIQAALRQKISRERVGVEVEKMLRGRDPYAAMCMFARLGLVPMA